MSLSSERNPGIFTVGPRPESNGRHTIVVLGIARGGTSMAAGVLHHLGVPMGSPAHPPIYEDNRFHGLFEAGDADAIRALAEQSADEWGVWGYKRPASAAHVDVIHDCFVAPRYVVIFRDPVAVSQRRQLALDGSPRGPGHAGSLRRLLRQYMEIAKFLQLTEPFALTVSYEKAVQSPADFVDALIDFADLTPTPDQRAAAIAFVEPEPDGYLRAVQQNRPPE